MHTIQFRRIFLSLAVLLVLLVSTSTVFAHAKYERSDPGRRSVVIRSPEQIKIWFSEQLEPAYSTIVVKTYLNLRQGNIAFFIGCYRLMGMWWIQNLNSVLSR